MSDANTVSGAAQESSSEKDHTFTSGAKRSKLMPRFDLIPAVFLRRLSARFELGLRYGEHNYKMGLPFDDTFNHIIEHLLAYKERRKEILKQQDGVLFHPGQFEEMMQARETDGDDLAAAAWGLAAIMYLEQAGRLL